MSLPRIRKGLLTHTLDNETIVYDPTVDRVHLLDPTTSRVFEVLNGTDDPPADLPAQELLALSLAELSKADLLEPEHAKSSALTEISRRELLRKAALTGVAAVFLPAITTIYPSTANAQGSCLPQCAPCTADAQCCTHCDARGGTRCGLVRDVCP